LGELGEGRFIRSRILRPEPDELARNALVPLGDKRKRAPCIDTFTPSRAEQDRMQVERAG
jgi:hypothetical protein